MPGIGASFAPKVRMDTESRNQERVPSMIDYKNPNSNLPATRPHRTTLAGIVLSALLGLGQTAVAGGSPQQVFADRFEISDLRMDYGSYLGLSDSTVREIVFDGAGNAVLVGHFASHPGNDVAGATVFGTPSSSNVFVAKYAPDGTRLWLTIVGGSGLDRGYGIDIDANDDLYVGGRTSSTDFPTTAGAFDRTHHGGVGNPAHGATDGYVFKLSADGSNLVYSTLFGGSGQEGNRGGLAVAPDGSAYACGSVEGNSTDFMQNPSSGNPVNFVNARPGGFSDAYIVKFLPDGSGVHWVRFHGSTNDTMGEELVVGCSVDASGRLVGVGNLWGDDAPVTDGSVFQGGNADMFTMILSGNGQTLHHAGYLGSAGDEFFEHRLALAGNGGFHAAGATTSTAFPMLGAYRGTAGSGKNSHGVVMQFSAAGQRVFSSYVAGDGSGDETAFVQGPDEAGRVYLTGRTESNDIAVSADAFQTANAGGEDAYIQVVDADGNPVYASFLGGSGDDYGRYIAQSDDSRRMVVALETDSTDLPVTPDADRPALHSSGTDVFVAFFTVPAASR